MGIGSLVLNSRLKWPVGYRFHPTDEELVVHYLKRKVLDLPLPAIVIPEYDVFMSDPWSLPGDSEEKNRYFFSKRPNGIDNGNKGNMKSTLSGHWKTKGKNRKIVASGISIGIKTTLSFYKLKNRNSHGTKKTPWIMHEFSLVHSSTNQMPKNKEMEEWVIYCVTKRRIKPKKNGGINKKSTTNSVAEIISTTNSIDDFMVQDSFDFDPPQPSSPSSSGISKFSSNGALDQEESSVYKI